MSCPNPRLDGYPRPMGGWYVGGPGAGEEEDVGGSASPRAFSMGEGEGRTSAVDEARDWWCERECWGALD